MIVAILLAASLAGLLVVPRARSVAVVTEGGTRRANALSSVPDSGLQDDPQTAASIPTATVIPNTAAPSNDAAAPKSSPSGQDASTSTITPTAPRPAAPATVRQTIDTGLWISDGGWKPLAWSPESSSVAVARGGDVLVFDAGTGARRPLISGPRPDRPAGEPGRRMAARWPSSSPAPEPDALRRRMPTRSNPGPSAAIAPQCTCEELSSMA